MIYTVSVYNGINWYIQLWTKNRDEAVAEYHRLALINGYENTALDEQS